MLPFVVIAFWTLWLTLDVCEARIQRQSLSTNIVSTSSKNSWANCGSRNIFQCKREVYLQGKVDETFYRCYMHAGSPGAAPTRKGVDLIEARSFQNPRPAAFLLNATRFSDTRKCRTLEYSPVLPLRIQSTGCTAGASSRPIEETVGFTEANLVKYAIPKGDVLTHAKGLLQKEPREDVGKCMSEPKPGPVAAGGSVGEQTEDRIEAASIAVLRSICRVMHLSAKGSRVEILERLAASGRPQLFCTLLGRKSMSCKSRISGDDVAAVHSAQHRQELPSSPTKTGAEEGSQLCGKSSYIECHACGETLARSARFCSSCGSTAERREEETLRDFVETAFLPAREQEVGEHTIRAERGFWRSILEVLGHMPLQKLSAASWEDYLKVLRRRNCSARTQALHQAAYISALSSMLHQNKIREKHTFRKIRGCTKRTLTAVPLTAKEVYLLLAATRSTMHAAMFALGIGAGLRPSEICRAQWEDFDFENETMKVRGSKTAAASAAIPLTDIACREMKRWWVEERRPSGGLCFYREGFRHIGQMGDCLDEGSKTPIKCFKKALQAAAKRAGINMCSDGQPRRIFPYILRHSFATIAASSNPPVPLPVAQAVMRHTSSKMLLETYAKAGALVIKEGLRNFKV